MKNDVVLLDGGIGTSLWEKSEDKVPVWRYNLEKPEIVTELHREFIAAGSQIILANTFGANGAAVSKSPYRTADVISEAVRLAKAAAAGTGVKVALSAGPLTGLLEPYGDISAEEAYRLYDEMFTAGMAEGPDLIALQTFMDLEMLKLARKAAAKHDVPVFCTMTFLKVGKTMMGNSVQDMLSGLADCPPAAVGLNCSLGPVDALPVMHQFREKTDLPLIFKPNAGKPLLDGGGKTAPEFDAETFANDVLPAAALGVTYIGGCCGANAAYIRRLGEKLRAQSEKGRR